MAVEILGNAVTHFFSWECVRSLVVVDTSGGSSNKKDADSASVAGQRTGAALGIGQH